MSTPLRTGHIRQGEQRGEKGARVHQRLFNIGGAGNRSAPYNHLRPVPVEGVRRKVIYPNDFVLSR